METEWAKFSKDKRASADGVKELMSRTFYTPKRMDTPFRAASLGNCEGVSMFEQTYICMFPLLYCTYLFYVLLGQVAHEMDMICQSEDMLEQFEENWRKFVGVILSYSKTIPFQTKELKQILEELGDDYDGKFDSMCVCIHIIMFFNSLHR